VKDKPTSEISFCRGSRGARGAAIALASLLALTPAFAQAPAVHFDNDLSEAEIVNRFAGTGASPPLDEGLKLRRIVISPDQAVAPHEGTSAAAHSPPSLQLKINFAFNSAQMDDEARQVLTKVASALKSKELMADHFIVAGHTDAVGSDAYNQKLSERRSRAVRDFLARAGVAAGRLYVVGYGRSQLADPTHPAAEVNRRVEIIKAGG
jgi:outer membrane protein OmpA-like peptidoglycan-associated protein